MSIAAQSLSGIRVLVLLAARNGAGVIERQIASVLSQHDVSVAIDIRDDDSSDTTREIVATLATREPRVRLMADHAASGSASANFFRLVAAANTSSFDLVAFCDQDDEWFPDKLARAAERITRSGAQGYSAATLARWPDGSERLLTQNAVQRNADYLFEGAGQGCTFVMTLKLFELLRSVVVRHPEAVASVHYHDWAVYALARSSGMGWYIDRQAVMTYHQHATNDTGARSSFIGVTRRLSAIRSGWYRAQVEAICRLVEACNPTDVWTGQWLALFERRGMITACSKLIFIIRNGRRRKSDRLMQSAAVMIGRL